MKEGSQLEIISQYNTIGTWLWNIQNNQVVEFRCIEGEGKKVLTKENQNSKCSYGRCTFENKLLLGEASLFLYEKIP